MNVQAEIARLQAKIRELKQVTVPVKFKKDMIRRIGLVVAEEGVAVVSRKHVYTLETYKIRKSNTKHLRKYVHGKRIESPKAEKILAAIGA
jgi:hypothetical protein